MAIAMAAARSFCISSALFLTVILFSVRIWFMGLRYDSSLLYIFFTG
jgi:hypothetical protein